MLALLNQAPPDTLDQLVRGGYLPNAASSASLPGVASSAGLRGIDSSHQGAHSDFGVTCLAVI